MRVDADPGRLRSTAAATPQPLQAAFPRRERAQAVADPLPAVSATGSAALRQERVYRCLLAITDATAALVSLVVCLQVLGDDALKLTSGLAVPLVLIIGRAQGLYQRDERLVNKSTLDEVPVLFHQATLYTLLVWLLDDTLFVVSLGNAQALALWATMLGSSAAGRQVARRAAARLSSPERIFVMGDGSAAERLRAAGKQVPGTIIGYGPLEDLSRHPGLLARLADEEGIDRVVVAPAEGTSSRDTLDAIGAANESGMRVSILPTFLDGIGSKATLDHVSGVTLLGIPPYGLARSSLLLKRSFDIVGSVLALALAAPLMLAIAVAIRLETPGPVVFRQTRIGRNGKAFAMLKFRSMVDDADEHKRELRKLNHAADGFFKISDDPRMTRVGRLIRRTYLDELPQLVNVLRGEMSLVGPRPLVIDEDVLITGRDRRRLQLTPGMTGPWQVLGSSRIPLTVMVKLDYLYVADWSLWNDVKILIRTIPVMFERQGQ
jgi:exopolysaccharide biosynthesis polyprenyl glycosylphosphotransferase